MAEPSPLFGTSLAGLVSEDEAALKGCKEWLCSLDAGVYWLTEALKRCERAEALSSNKQASALAGLRDAAHSLSDVLIEGEEHVDVVTAPIPQLIREEMYALQDPLIAIAAPTPTGFRSWPNIREKHYEALLASTEGVIVESRHIKRLVERALAVHRQKQAPDLNESNPKLTRDINGNVQLAIKDSRGPQSSEHVTANENGVPTSPAPGAIDSAAPKPKRRGRKKADYETVQEESQLAAKWRHAREGGTYKGDFARDHRMTLEDFDRLLDRVRARKRASD